MSTDVFWCLVILWFCSYGTPSQGGETCAVSREIGEPQLLSCFTKNFSVAITVQLKVNNGFVNVSSCNTLGECTDNMAPVYTSMYHGLIEYNGDQRYSMQVNIDGTRRNETTFRCVYDDIVTGAVCFEMFVRPSTPVCDSPVLVDSDTKLSISCISEKVYPAAYILIRVIQDGKIYPTIHYEVDFESKMSPSLKNPGYNVEHSTVRIPLSSLEPNNYEFVVWMLPDISNNTLASDRRSEPPVISYVVLTAPKVRLSSSCPVDSYVTSGTCKCELSPPGHPPGQAKWYTQSGQVVGTENSEDRSSTINVTYDSEGSPASYECRAWTVLNVSSPNAVPFTPKLPVGPNSVIIESSAVDGNFDLCPSEESINMVVTCKVPTEDVKPGVTLTIVVNSDIVVDQQEASKIGSYYLHNYNFRPSNGRSYNAECRAHNSISSQLLPSKPLSFDVREPPPSPPVLHIPPNQQGSDVATVEIGKTIDITCKVDGGYPKVSEVTITCGSKKQTSPSYIATLTLEVTQSLDGQICYCTATHDSGCYDKESNVSLKVEEATEEDQSQDLDQTLIIALPVAAAVVIIVHIVIIIILFMRKTKRTPAPATATKPATAPPPPTNDHTYSHLMTSSPGQDDYIIPIHPVDHDYDVIITNEEVSSNGQWSYNNPAFTGPGHI